MYETLEHECIIEMMSRCRVRSGYHRTNDSVNVLRTGIELLIGGDRHVAYRLVHLANPSNPRPND